MSHSKTQPPASHCSMTKHGRSQTLFSRTFEEGITQILPTSPSTIAAPMTSMASFATNAATVQLALKEVYTKTSYVGLVHLMLPQTSVYSFSVTMCCTTT